MRDVCNMCGGASIILTEGGIKICKCSVFRMKGYGFPDAFQNESFDTFVTGDDVSLNLAKKRAEAVADRLTQRGKKWERGVIITGGVGVGKTHLACAIARRFVESHGGSALFISEPAIIPELAESNRTPFDVAKWAARDFDITVYDDLGAAASTEYRTGLIEAVVDAMYNQGNQVIFTSDYGFGENDFDIVQLNSILSERTVSRLSALTQIHIVSNDKRPGRGGR